MSKILRGPSIRRDLTDIAYYYIREGTPATARRFREQAELFFRRLAEKPELGPRFENEHPELTELRFRPIPRFENYLVFYKPIPGGIVLVRVLHAARDLPNLLMADLASDE